MAEPAESMSPEYREVWGFQPLLRAFRKARRAKRGKGGEPAFYLHLEENLLRLSAELAGRRWAPDPYRYFVVRHTKERVVAEATFRDRVVHHSLVGALEPAFEARFLPWSYASRAGLGTHAAIRRVQGLCRQPGSRYFLRLDVARFFESMDHEVVLRQIAAVTEDPGIRWLCATILEAAEGGPDTSPGRGVPIGNLTSQFWANVVLDAVDQQVVVGRGIETWARYMDDMVAFAPDKRSLWRLADDVRGMLGALRLQAREDATRVAPVREGVPWLGFLVWPERVRLQREGRRRLARKLAASVARAEAGAQEVEAGRAASLCAHASTAGG